MILNALIGGCVMWGFMWKIPSGKLKFPAWLPFLALGNMSLYYARMSAYALMPYSQGCRREHSDGLELRVRLYIFRNSHTFCGHEQSRRMLNTINHGFMRDAAVRTQDPFHLPNTSRRGLLPRNFRLCFDRTFLAHGLDE